MATESFPTFTNRHGLKVFVKLLMLPKSIGNVYIAHGFSDVHDTVHMRALTASFLAAGYNVILWDATHSWGRSAGNIEQATFYYHHEDMEDVVEWSKTQSWFRAKFMVAGHSLGGMIVGTYAATHAEQVIGLVLVSPVISGPALRQRIPWPIRMWWRWRGQIRVSRRGMNRVSWEFIRSSWSYDLNAVAHRLRAPLLIVAAGQDVLIPPRLARKLFGLINSEKKELVIMAGARHGFDKPQETMRLQKCVEQWLRTTV